MEEALIIDLFFDAFRTILLLALMHPIVDSLVVHGILDLITLLQDLSVTGHAERSFLDLWDAIVVQNVAMERLVTLVLDLFEVVILLLHLLLLLGRLIVLPIYNLLRREGSFDNAHHIFAYNVLNLKRQVLLDKVVGGADDPEVIVRREPDRLNLIFQLVPRLHKFIRVDFHLAELADGDLVSGGSFISQFDELVHFFDHGIELLDLLLTEFQLLIEDLELVCEFEFALADCIGHVSDLSRLVKLDLLHHIISSFCFGISDGVDTFKGLHASHGLYHVSVERLQFLINDCDTVLGLVPVYGDICLDLSQGVFDVFKHFRFLII